MTAMTKDELDVLEKHVTGMQGAINAWKTRHGRHPQTDEEYVRLMRRARDMDGWFRQRHPIKRAVIDVDQVAERIVDLMEDRLAEKEAAERKRMLDRMNRVREAREGMTTPEDLAEMAEKFSALTEEATEEAGSRSLESLAEEFPDATARVLTTETLMSDEELEARRRRWTTETESREIDTSGDATGLARYLDKAESGLRARNEAKEALDR